jgi:hypothetical protein
MKAPVILATDNHLFTAAVPTRGNRLLEVLNDHTTEYLVVNDFRLYSDKDGDDAARPPAVVRKSNLALAMLPTLHEAAERRMYYFVAKKSHPCRIVVGDYTIAGNLSLRGAPDLNVILSTELQHFFPITEAIVSHTGLRAAVKPSVVLVNKDKVAALQLGEAVVNQRRPLVTAKG